MNQDSWLTLLRDNHNVTKMVVLIATFFQNGVSYIEGET